MDTGHQTSVGHFTRGRVLRALTSACAIALLATATCFASTVTLQWNANTETNLAGYKVYYKADSSTVPFTGTGATQGASPINVAKNTSATISGLDPGRPYHFAITAYNTAGAESPYSTIVSIPELTRPTVSITSPTNSAAVSGTVSVTASASDNVGVTRLEFYVNGLLQATDTSTPYLYSWNTATLTSGTYTLTAKAYDAAGNVGAATVSVTVVNDRTAPTVSLTAPASNATVMGTVPVTATASDNVGVSKVEFYRDGVLLSAGNVAPYSYSWNTSTVANGSHTLLAKAYDAMGNIGQSANVVVAVNNTVAPPPGTYTAVLGNATGATYPNTIQDTYLNINSTVNAAGASLNTYTWPAYKPANAILMQWNLSGLPANAKIQSATLNLYMNGAGGDSSYQIPVSKVINKMPLISKSNGNTYDGLNAWTPSSVPYNSIPLAQSDIGPAVVAPLLDKTYGYKSWNVTSIVSEWLAYPANNRGLLLNSSNKAASNSYRNFASSEAIDATKRPKLVVIYTLP